MEHNARELSAWLKMRSETPDYLPATDRQKMADAAKLLLRDPCRCNVRLDHKAGLQHG